MAIGTVKFFNTDKGYGFIENEDGSGDSFVHITAVQAAGMDTLRKEQRGVADSGTDFQNARGARFQSGGEEKCALGAANDGDMVTAGFDF